MAEGGHPASEPYPQGAVVSCDSSTFSPPNSKTSVDTLTSSRRTETHHPESSSSHIRQEHQRDTAAAATTFTEPPSAPSSSRSTRETPDVRGQEAGEKPRLQPPRAPGRPHSIAEAYPLPHRGHEEAPSASHHGVDPTHRLQPACLPVQRSHSDSVPLFKQGSVVPQPPPHHGGGDTRGPGGAYPVLDYGPQEPQGRHHAVQACQQPLQLQQQLQQQLQLQQQYKLFTVTCSPPPPQQQQPHHSQHEDVALCCGSYAHPGVPEDTFASYYHSHQPIPGPHAEADRTDQRMAALSSHPVVPAILGLPPPRLMSSVSETGLDAKRMLHCNCSWVSSLPPGVVLQPQQQQQQQLQQQRSGLNEVCSGAAISTSSSATTRDIGTMTAHRQLVDSGVQTEQSPPAHVFPQVCLVEENGNAAADGNLNNKSSESGESAGSSSATGGKKSSSSGNAQNKSPVKEVKWDAEGMTWEVYGASVDPEELGLAIQRHLELQIKETAGRAAKLCRQDTNNTSRQSAAPVADSRRRKRSRMMGSIRTPTCCARSSTAVD